jgi:hypothetical protein
MAVIVFRNLLRRRPPEILAAVRAGFAVEEFVTSFVDSIERKPAASRTADLAPFARCTSVDSVSVERMQGSHVLLERIDKQVSFFPIPSSDKPLVLRLKFDLERSCSHLVDLDDYSVQVTNALNGASLIRVSDGAATHMDCASIDSLVEAWCAEHPQGEKAQRDARWFISAVLAHPSDHCFDLISDELGV